MNKFELILILSILGLVNDIFLHWQYRRLLATGKKMFCVIGGECGEVVSSVYGKTFGIKNEIFGFFYYVLMIVFSLGAPIGLISLIATFVASIFSIRLFYIQSMVLKKYCSWCLIAIVINILLLFLLLSS